MPANRIFLSFAKEPIGGSSEHRGLTVVPDDHV